VQFWRREVGELVCVELFVARTAADWIRILS